MNRFADEIVPFEFRIAWRRASWPTRRSPCSVNATTEGVVRDPSALGITTGWPPSTVAITEFVVPRSIPTALAIVMLLSTRGGLRTDWGRQRPAGRRRRRRSAHRRPHRSAE